MSEKILVLIKIGGRPARQSGALNALLSEIKALQAEYDFVLVHGGGAEVSSISRHYGIEPRFIDGIRQTSEAEMDIIDMGLAGKMNTAILRRALALDLPAIGLSGVDAGLFTGGSIDPAGANRTGRVREVRPAVIGHLHSGGYLPVISSVSSDLQGAGLNINADDAAQALAVALKPERLIFISDIPGILDGDPADSGTAVISTIDGSTAGSLISSGIVHGGMIPKLRNALDIVHSGTGEVIIGSLDENGGLADLIKHRRGTRVIPDNDSPAPDTREVPDGGTSRPDGAGAATERRQQR